MKQSDVIGAWRLQEFAIEGADGVSRPWGEGMRGLLIYERSGAMSVSIQREVPDPRPSDWAPLDGCLFYAGTFRFSTDHMVEHHVEIATDPKRVGQVLVRNAILEGDLLRLSDHAALGGAARITWRRIA